MDSKIGVLASTTDEKGESINFNSSGTNGLSHTYHPLNSVICISSLVIYERNAYEPTQQIGIINASAIFNIGEQS